MRPYAVKRISYEEPAYQISRNCLQCGVTTVAPVKSADLWHYENNGPMVQDCFPYMNADNREALFMSGICYECWALLIANEEEYVFAPDPRAVLKNVRGE